MPKKDVRISKRSKHLQKNPITYHSEKHVSKFINETSAFAKWCEREELKIAGRTDKQDFCKAYDLFLQERDKKKRALWTLQQRAQEEKAKRGLLRPGSEWVRHRRRDWSTEIAVRAPETIQHVYFAEHEVPPTKTSIYSRSPAVASNLIYPCPDHTQWGANLEDDEVTLNQGYRYWFPEKTPPLLAKLPGVLVFSGLFITNTRFQLTGIVSIGRSGSVTVDVATYITVVECNSDDKNHDGGWHYDPSFDRLISTWRSYCDGNQNRMFSDTREGLHDFAHYIDLPVEVVCSYGAPNRFVEVTHILTITVVNAACQFGPNRAACLDGSSPLRIITQWPIIELEYIGYRHYIS